MLLSIPSKYRQSRISRLTYLKGLLLSLLLIGAVVVVLGLLFALFRLLYESLGAPQNGSLYQIANVLAIALPDIISAAIIICLFLAYVILTIRRLHDIGLSGWVVLISLIPFLGFLLVLFLLFKRGEPLTNRYGPDPE